MQQLGLFQWDDCCGVFSELASFLFIQRDGFLDSSVLNSMMISQVALQITCVTCSAQE
jgi:hypothetical protein